MDIKKIDLPYRVLTELFGSYIKSLICLKKGQFGGSDSIVGRVLALHTIDLSSIPTLSYSSSQQGVIPKCRAKGKT